MSDIGHKVHCACGVSDPSTHRRALAATTLGCFAPTLQLAQGSEVIPRPAHRIVKCRLFRLTGEGVSATAADRRHRVNPVRVPPNLRTTSLLARHVCASLFPGVRDRWHGCRGQGQGCTDAPNSATVATAQGEGGEEGGVGRCRSNEGRLGGPPCGLSRNKLATLGFELGFESPGTDPKHCIDLLHESASLQDFVRDRAGFPNR